MKKLTIILSIAAMMLAVSCNKTEAPAQEDVVTYSVSMPVTKAVSADGSSINKVWYALYKMDGTLVKDYGTVDFTGGNAHCSVVMMRGQSYKIAFVAQHEGVYGVDAQEKTISMPSAPVANSDDYDLFYKLETVEKYSGVTSDAVALDRAVALVNFYSSKTDWNNVTNLGLVPDESAVVLKDVPATFDLLTGAAVETTTDITYSKAGMPSTELVGESVHVAAAYCFAPTTNNIKAGVKLYNDEDLISEVEVDNVPVGSNKKTNITGSVMTGSVDFTISITTGADETENREI